MPSQREKIQELERRNEELEGGLKAIRGGFLDLQERYALPDIVRRSLNSLNDRFQALLGDEEDDEDAMGMDSPSLEGRERAIYQGQDNVQSTPPDVFAEQEDDRELGQYGDGEPRQS